MAYQVLLDADYTFDANEKTITLLGDYATLELPQIKSIRNITKGRMVIYDCDNPDSAIAYTAPIISWTQVFAYKGTAFADTDDLQIIIDIATIGTTTPLNVLVDDSTPVDVEITNALPIPVLVDATVPVDINVTNSTSIPVAVDPLSPIVIDDSTPVDVNITNPNLMNLSDVLSVYSSQSVTASTTVSSTGKDLRNVSYANIFIKNATSTNLTVNVYGSPDAAGTFKALIGTATLNTTTTQAEIELDKVPNYVFFDLINSDSTNAATVSISVQRTISTDVVRPYADVLEVYSSESVGASSTTSSTGQDVRGAAYVIPYVKNAISTALTVNIYGSYNLAGTIKTLIRSYALTDTITQAGDPITKVPNYLFFDLVNADASNAATVDVSVQRG